MIEPDRKVNVREGETFDTNSKSLLGLILRKLVENHPQIVCRNNARLWCLESNYDNNT